MRDFSHFLWRCIETSVRLTWDTASTVGVICFVILAIVLVANPEKQQTAGAVLAKLTVLLLVVVFLTRLASSPYLVYKSRDGEITSRDNQIHELRDEVKRLQDNNQLAAFLSQQAEATKKGSLSNRATTLAKQILEAVEAHRKEDNRVYEQRSKSMTATDQATREAAWDEMNRKSIESYQAFDRLFHQRFTPRIIALADEFRENGLTEPKLEEWVQFPNTAAYTFTLTEVAVALSRLAIKMEDKEKGVAQPTPSTKQPD